MQLPSSLSVLQHHLAVQWNNMVKTYVVSMQSAIDAHRRHQPTPHRRGRLWPGTAGADDTLRCTANLPLTWHTCEQRCYFHSIWDHLYIAGTETDINPRAGVQAPPQILHHPARPE